MHGKCLLPMLFPPFLNPWCMQRQLAVRRCPLASPPRTIAAERPVETADQRTANGASAQAQVRRMCGQLPELSLAERTPARLVFRQVWTSSSSLRCQILAIVLNITMQLKKACEDHESAHW